MSTSTKIATIQDVALAVGVTKTTVSKVFNGKGSISPATAEAVREAAKRLNFEPNPDAQRLSRGSTSNTVAIFSGHMRWYSGSLKMILVQNRVAAAGFDAPAHLCNITNQPHTHQQAIASLKALRLQRPRAIVFSTGGLLTATPDGRPTSELSEAAIEELQKYLDSGGIVVNYDTYVDLNCDQVLFDRVQNTYQTTRHLLEIGHRDIGFCDAGAFYPRDARFEGYRRALEEYGLTPREEWLLFPQQGIDGTFDLLSYEGYGAHLAGTFLQWKTHPTAMCIADDSTAIGFIGEIMRAGWRIPDDLSVTGDDDTPTARFGPLRLTTTCHPIERIAYSVVQLLEDRLKNNYEGPARTIEVQSELVVRESTRSLM